MRADLYSADGKPMQHKHITALCTALHLSNERKGEESGQKSTSSSVQSWLCSPNRKLMLLAPSSAAVADNFRGSKCAPRLYDRLLAKVQRLRGLAYLEDGAVEASELTRDGRHVSPVDTEAWHVVSMDALGHIYGCARYMAHPNTVCFSDLIARSSALAWHPKWGDRLRRAIEADIATARRRGVAYVEVGGWALHKEARCTREVLRVALATYALSRTLGGCIGLSTATVRHCSADILQKIGGRPLEFSGAPLPLYYDPQYRCEMAMLRFDSDESNPRYEHWTEEMQAQLSTVPVVYHDAAGEAGVGSWRLVRENVLSSDRTALTGIS